MTNNWSTKKWTADEDAAVMRGREAGVSFGNIAAELPGRTRNSVAGRAFRLGLCAVEKVLDGP